MTDPLLANQIALVTGAAGGNGRAIAVTYAAAGADVLLVDLNTAGLEETAALVRERGRRAAVQRADVGDAGQVEGMVAACVAAFGRLDVLVNNAGIMRPGSILDLAVEDWDLVTTVNLKGVIYGMQAGARQMIAQGRGGVIVNMSSSSSVFPVPNNANYAASKAAVSLATRTAAWELGQHEIRVNAIAPGGIRTAMTVNAFSAPTMPEWESRIPAGRAGVPEDVADVALFLASDLARYITGQTLHVDGGSTLLNGRSGVYGAFRHHQP